MWSLLFKDETGVMFTGIVFFILFFRDYTIISGDSTGKTSFWNGRQGTLIKVRLFYHPTTLI